MSTARLTFRAIGWVDTSTGSDQPVEDRNDSECRVHIDGKLSPGLEGLRPGQHIMIIYAFDRSQSYELLQHPKGDRRRRKRGVFSLRSPGRPNPIGVTLVQLIALEGNVLHVAGLDAFDGTPVLDIKPATKEEQTAFARPSRSRAHTRTRSNGT